jgi:hypothetical protein
MKSKIKIEKINDDYSWKLYGGRGNVILESPCSFQTENNALKNAKLARDHFIIALNDITQLESAIKRLKEGG